MRIDFLTPRIRRLNADGTIQVVLEGGVAGRLLQRPVLVLARELCSFNLFQTSVLPRSKRRQAAELQARTSAPYVRSNFILSKSRGDYGLWWWNQDLVERLIPPELARSKPIICPETLTQPAVPMSDETWRIVRLPMGYEAQLWRDKALVASAWRRERFDASAWGAFVRLQRAEFEASEQPPVPSELPINYDPRLIQSPVHMSREQIALMAGGGVIMASLCLAAFIGGQSLQIKKSVAEVEAETAQIRANTPRTAMSADLNADQKSLVAYQTLENQTNPITSSGAAIGILAYHDISPISLRAELDSLTLVISHSHLDQVETLVADLQTSGYFYDIRPRSDRPANTLTFEMKVQASAPPLGRLD